MSNDESVGRFAAEAYRRSRSVFASCWVGLCLWPHGEHGNEKKTESVFNARSVPSKSLVVLQNMPYRICAPTLRCIFRGKLYVFIYFLLYNRSSKKVDLALSLPHSGPFSKWLTALKISFRCHVGTRLANSFFSIPCTLALFSSTAFEYMRLDSNRASGEPAPADL